MRKKKKRKYGSYQNARQKWVDNMKYDDGSARQQHSIVFACLSVVLPAIVGQDELEIYLLFLRKTGRKQMSKDYKEIQNTSK